ncbi:MAG: nucleotidyltransferase domain-containing protein, partial [Candidatus Binatia bacterium]
MEPKATQRATDALRNEIDWDFLIDGAIRHGVAPLLFRNLSRSSREEIPDRTLTQLRHVSGSIACRNLFLTGELLTLLRLFGEIGISALPLKGPLLGVAAYGDLSLRPFNDLDILMPQKDILKAKDVLLERGYEPKTQLTSAEERVYVQTHHDYKFTRRNDEVVVEIQWGVTQWSFAFEIDFDEIWERRKQIVLAGAAVPLISTEDLLLALCVHGAKHRWERLKWICDIAELVGVARDSIDWVHLTSRARALGGERMLLLGLFLAHDLLDANLPSEVLKIIQSDSQIRWLFGRVGEGLFGRRLDSDELSDERPFFYWRVRERLQDKLAVARRY